MKVREGYYSEQVRNQAFESILDKLGKKQGEVYHAILKLQPVSNEDIAAYLNILPHQVTPRVLELRQMEIVEYAGDSRSKTSGKKVSLWRIRPEGKQLTLFN
jgi:DNA-binding MarR family transcriptional regulator